MKKVLCVVTSNNVKGDTGIPTGFWFSELTHPMAKLEEAGFETALASIKGGEPPLDKDGFDLSDSVNKKYWEDIGFQKKFKNTLCLSDIKVADYDAIFFAGGHGVMWDFPGSEAVQRVTREIYEAGGLVSAVCHGPAALVNVKLSNGKHLVSGKNVTSFTDAEEAEVQATDIVPFLLESTLRAHGALHHPAENWTSNVIVDGRLVTGQNPASAAGVGEALVKLLQR